MSSEVPKFTIPPEITDAVMDEAGSYDETLEYAKLMMAQAREQHPDLYGYLAQTAGEQGEYWYSYAIASALSYDVVTRQLQAARMTVDITPNDLTKHRAHSDKVFNDPRWNDEAWVLERTGRKDGVEVDSGLGFFLNVVDAVAPEFAESIADFTPQVEMPQNRRHTLRGFYDGFMPFYTKIQKEREMNSAY